MRNSFFFVFFVLALFLTSQTLSQEFQFQMEPEGIAVFASGISVQSPFAGGINSSAPTFIDIDNDGDLDLFIGEGGTRFFSTFDPGKMFFFRNVGTPSNPVFSFETNEFASVDVSGGHSRPTFADIDNDGDFDLFVGGAGGSSRSNIIYYRNIGTLSEGEFSLVGNLALGFIDRDSAPNYADIDNDDDFDLFIGTRNGSIEMFRNDGNVNAPIFVNVPNSFSSIDIGTFSIPFFVDIDSDEDFDLVVGSDENFGDDLVSFYLNIGSQNVPEFVPASNIFPSLVPIIAGAYNTPTLSDIDSDGDFDLFIGGLNGNITFYKNVNTPSEPLFSLETNNFLTIDAGFFSSPTFADIDGDKDLDLFIGSSSTPRIIYYKNTGSPTVPEFTLISDNFVPSTSESSGLGPPNFVDIDNDGDLDLIYRGKFFPNSGTSTNPLFANSTSNFPTNFAPPMSSRSAFADIDNDGDLDYFLGIGAGSQMQFYKNIGSPTRFEFILEPSQFDSINIGAVACPFFADIDLDNDLDLFIGEELGNVNFYRNIGTPSTPDFVLETENFASTLVRRNSIPSLVDIDSDGDLDLFIGEWGGGIHFYRNSQTVNQISIINSGNHSVDLFPNFPNPFMYTTTISYRIAIPQDVKLSIYDFTGREVKTLIKKKQTKGNYQFQWDGTGDNGESLPNGIYICQLNGTSSPQIIKIVLMK